MTMSLDASQLYALLPAIYRTRDVENGGPLQALLTVAAEQVAVVEENIRQLYDDYCVLSDGKWYGPSDFNNLTVGWYLNHSSDPNVAYDSEFNFTTLRHIHKHEELSVDYRMHSETGRELES